MAQFRRIAIVNRGEAAMRVLHAIGELSSETGRDYRSIALHTVAERGAAFVREADEAVCFADLDAVPAGSPYLDLAVLEEALLAARAEAVWVGWGFVAERAEFADLCDRMGIAFIGPSGDVMRLLGDKIAAKQLADKADVPMAPWSGGPVDSIDDAIAAAASIGFPLMVKAAAGGGGRGIRRVEEPDGLAAAVESARSEGAKSFGDPTVFLERVVTDARHVEVQIIADHHGTVWAPGVRDCSVQRKNQKVLEESASTALSPERVDELKDAAIRLAQKAGYQNAGTVEFLYQPAEDLLAFLEVNTRLQVEHPVTELTTGIDLVKWQIRVAHGERLEGDPPPARGHAIEARLNAEDPAAGFAPSPGRITTFVTPAGPGIRVDTGVAEGDEISPDYDSMIAKVIAHGGTRDEALARLRRALSQTTVAVAGGTTNKSFLLDLLDQDEVRTGRLDTGWLDRLTAGGGHVPTRHAAIGLLVAAVVVHDDALDLSLARFLSSAARGRPQLDDTVGVDVQLRHGGQEYRVHVAAGDPRGWYRCTVDRTTVDLIVDRLGRGRSRVRLGGEVHRVVSQVESAEVLVEIDGVGHRFSRDDGGLLRAPSAALVVSVDVRRGDMVEVGQRIVTLEAMKMETILRAPVAGEVEEVLVDGNMQVDAGTPLLRITGAASSDDVASDRITPAMPGPTTTDGDATADRLNALRALLLGFDVDDGAVATMLREHLGADRPAEVRRAELDLLQMFADSCSVTRDVRVTSLDEHEPRSPHGQLSAFLRTFDLEREDLPDRFTERLLLLLAHYGITDLERTPDLERAMYRLHRAMRRRPVQLDVVRALLELRLAGRVEADERDRLRDTLDALVAATQTSFAAIGNLARSVRHRCIDAPVLESAIETNKAVVRSAFDRLVESPHDGETLDALVNSVIPIVGIAGQSGTLAAGPARGRVVEALLRRFYKIRDLDPTTPIDGDVLRTGYRHRNRRVVVLGVATDLAELHDALASAAAAVDEGDEHVVIDVYALRDALTTVHDLAQLGVLLANAAELPPAVERIVIVSTTDDGQVETITVHRTNPGDEFAEESVLRSLHPMVARRLHLWRLANFDVSRLPSAEDTHLFRCTAIENPSDERLVAVAEVRDITPLRDSTGRLVALPELERVLANCLDGIRQELARSGDRHLEWNRVMLYVWPPVEISLDEVDDVARRLVPLTRGLGMEQTIVHGRLVDPDDGSIADVAVRIGYETGGMTIRVTESPTAPMRPLDDYTQKVLQCRRRGTTYPYELVPLLVREPDGPSTGRFEELDLDDAGRLVPVDRPHGQNVAAVIVGRVTTPTEKHPEGMTRLAIFGDPTKAMGSITEAECRRLVAAIDLADAEHLPIEWFALSAGARIAMDSGSENLDWVASVLRRIVQFTQAGGEINVIVAGINVGAQPYWNAEATMLMHTRGILVMTPESAMVLTGKQAIDFSGGVSADDNLGIGGYERIMGPNGQAQYWAADLTDAVDLLFEHYEHTYVAPGEHRPRSVESIDPRDRNVLVEPHDDNGTGVATIGEIFSAETNPERKKPFDARSLLKAVVDRDHPVLERWPEMADAEAAVVADAHLGGHPVAMVAIESRPLPRPGVVPADGPDSWSAGTLFPLSSKKVARAINSASGNRPVVVLANLSGFDGSPESLRRLQLEYGAEIGRSIVNFDGPIVLCVVSRYHGGAFVVFSNRLNDRMEVLAVEGSYASVIGGAPAAAVVFTREVNARTAADPRVRALEGEIAAAPVAGRSRLRTELATLRSTVRNEMLGAVAAEFDATHSVQRALDVGSVHRIITAKALRPELIDAVERGLARP